MLQQTRCCRLVCCSYHKAVCDRLQPQLFLVLISQILPDGYGLYRMRLQLGYQSRSQRFLRKKSNSMLRIYRPSALTVASHWFCAMENTVSFGDAVPIPNAVSRAMLNNLSICCINGFCFYNLNPLMIPSHTSIGLFNNQQWVKERNIHLSKYTFQTGSAGW